MYSSRSTPPTFTPSAVIDTDVLSRLENKAAPGGRYHISLAGFAQSELSNMTPLLSANPALPLFSIPAVPAGVDGPNMDADPEGYGKVPVVRSQGVAEMLAGVVERSRK